MGNPTSSGEKYDPEKYTAAHPSLEFQTLLRVTNKSNNKTVVVRVNDRGPHTKSRVLDLSRVAAQDLDMISQGTADVRVEVINTKDEDPDSDIFDGIDDFMDEEDEEVVESPQTSPQKEKQPLETPKETNTETAQDSEAEAPKITTLSEASESETPDRWYVDLPGSRITPKGYGVQIGAFLKYENALKYSEIAASKGLPNVILEYVRIDGAYYHRVIIGDYKSEELANEKKSEIQKSGFTRLFLYRFPE